MNQQPDDPWAAFRGEGLRELLDGLTAHAAHRMGWVPGRCARIGGRAPDDFVFDAVVNMLASPPPGLSAANLPAMARRELERLIEAASGRRPTLRPPAVEDDDDQLARGLGS